MMMSSLNEKACARSITLAGPHSDPTETLSEIIEAWWDLEFEEQGHSWKLTMVNQARSWSPNKDLLHPVYVLTRKGDPFQLQRPPWGLGSFVGAPLLGDCCCPSKMDQYLSLLGSCEMYLLL